MVGDVAFSVQSLLGANGGALGIAFGAGAAAGWSFAISTAYKSMKNQLSEQREAHRRQQEECDRRISLLERKVEELSDRERQGLLRQIEQARQSAEHLVGRIDQGRLKPMDGE